MTEEHHESQSDDEPKLDEEVMEDLDTPSEEAEDVKGGRASSEPFISRCG